MTGQEILNKALDTHWLVISPNTVSDLQLKTYQAKPVEAIQFDRPFHISDGRGYYKRGEAGDWLVLTAGERLEIVNDKAFQRDYEICQ